MAENPLSSRLIKLKRDDYTGGIRWEKDQPVYVIRSINPDNNFEEVTMSIKEWAMLSETLQFRHKNVESINLIVNFGKLNSDMFEIEYRLKTLETRSLG